MQPGKPNECGVLEASLREVVATHGRGYAAIRIALCEDGLYRIGVEMHYAHGGFSFPISVHAEGFSTLNAARTAALELLLRSWHHPFPSEPDSVRAQLAALRTQVEARLNEPTLFSGARRFTFRFTCSRRSCILDQQLTNGGNHDQPPGRLRLLEALGRRPHRARPGHPRQRAV